MLGAEARHNLMSMVIDFLYQSDIAAALARAGDIAGGLALVREIGKDVDKPFQIICWSELPRALVEVAREQAKAGALAAAIETLREARSAALERTQKDSLSSDRVRTIAEAQVELGDLAGAKISAAAIETDDVEKALALAALARGQAKAGDRQAASDTLREAHARAQAIRAHRHHRRDRRTQAGGPRTRKAQAMTAPRDREPAPRLTQPHAMKMDS